MAKLLFFKKIAQSARDCAVTPVRARRRHGAVSRAAGGRGMSRRCPVLRLTDERASRHGRGGLFSRRIVRCRTQRQRQAGRVSPGFSRSAVAIVVGFLSVAVFSLATDQVLHVIGVYPPWGEPMYDTGLNLLALSYRTLYTILGGYITAALAPHAPMRHVMVVAALGSLRHGRGDCGHQAGESRTQLVSDCARDYGAPVRVARWGDSWCQAIWEVRPLACFTMRFLERMSFADRW